MTPFDTAEHARTSARKAEAYCLEAEQASRWATACALLSFLCTCATALLLAGLVRP